MTKLLNLGVVRKADALDGELHPLPEADERDEISRIFDSAGFDNCTAVDSAMRNPCMLSAGFEMLAGGDDSYYEV